MSEPHIRLLIADDINETRALIKRLLEMDDRFEVVGEATNGHEVIKFVSHNQVDMVLMDINMPELNGLEATEQLTKSFPEIMVVIMSVQSEREYLKKAMLYGAKEYIVKPFNLEIVVQTLLTTYQQNEHLVKVKAETNTLTTKIISYFGSKGGVGKTMLAVNTAIGLTKHHKKVLLIDADLQFGDVALMLGIEHKRTITDIVEDHADANFTLLKTYFEPYHTDVDVLLAPAQPEQAEYVDKTVYMEIIKKVKGHYDYIVCDLGVNYDEVTLSLLDQSDQIHFVTSMELTALRNSKQGLQVMRSLNYEADKVKVILNMSASQYGITLKDVEKALKRPVDVEVSDFGKLVKTSINMGEPLALQSKLKLGKLSKQLQQINALILA